MHVLKKSLFKVKNVRSPATTNLLNVTVDVLLWRAWYIFSPDKKIKNTAKTNKQTTTTQTVIHNKAKS